jgi:hypothetical protein
MVRLSADFLCRLAIDIDDAVNHLERLADAISGQVPQAPGSH